MRVRRQVGRWAGEDTSRRRGEYWAGEDTSGRPREDSWAREDTLRRQVGRTHSPSQKHARNTSSSNSRNRERQCVLNCREVLPVVENCMQVQAKCCSRWHSYVISFFQMWPHPTSTLAGFPRAETRRCKSSTCVASPQVVSKRGTARSRVCGANCARRVGKPCGVAGCGVKTCGVTCPRGVKEPAGIARCGVKIWRHLPTCRRAVGIHKSLPQQKHGQSPNRIGGVIRIQLFEYLSKPVGFLVNDGNLGTNSKAHCSRDQISRFEVPQLLRFRNSLRSPDFERVSSFPDLEVSRLPHSNICRSKFQNAWGHAGLTGACNAQSCHWAGTCSGAFRQA